MTTKDQIFGVELGPAVGGIGRTPVHCTLVPIHKIVPGQVGADGLDAGRVHEVVDVVAETGVHDVPGP